MPSKNDEPASQYVERVPRFQYAQVDRGIIHPLLPQQLSLVESGNRTNDVTLSTGTAEEVNNELLHSVQSHTFIVAADTQLGMTNDNRSWDIEIEYSRQAVERINALRPRPLYCCICGDLVNMCADIYSGKPKPLMNQQGEQGATATATTNTNTTDCASSTSEQENLWTDVECDIIQEQQNDDMKQIWCNLHPDIALICLCGNHDVGNRPTSQSIQKFSTNFGDDYLAFWANRTYNIVLNSSLFSDPTAAKQLYTEQLQWLQQKLEYANRSAARNIFIFSHHPWFIYNENEDVDDLTGISYLIPGNTDIYVSDSYFPIPKVYRQCVMELFRRHNVSACFAGHFHQNVVSKSTFGMDMIITGGLSMVLESTSNHNLRKEPSTQGFRIVTVEHNSSGSKGVFHHRFVSIGNDEPDT